MDYKAGNFIAKIKEMCFLVYLNTLEHQYDDMTDFQVILFTTRKMVEILCWIRGITANNNDYEKDFVVLSVRSI